MGVEVFYAKKDLHYALSVRSNARLALSQWEPPLPNFELCVARLLFASLSTRGLPMDGLLSSEAPAFEPVGVEGADAYRFEPAELGRLLGQVSLRRLSGPLLAPPTQPVRTAAGGREPH
jgi:hypothetical protein